MKKGKNNTDQARQTYQQLQLMQMDELLKLQEEDCKTVFKKIPALALSKKQI